MNPLALVAVVLLAVLVGLAIPVLLQLRSTLVGAQRCLASTSTGVDGALLDLKQLTARLNHVVGEVEGNLPRVRRALDATDGLVGALETAGSSLRVAAAVGPAALAGIKALIAALVAPKSPAEDQGAVRAGARDPEESSQHAAASSPHV